VAANDHPFIIKRVDGERIRHHEKKINKAISEVLMLAKTTPKDIRRRYCERGLKGALYDAPRPGQPTKFNGKEKAKITAIACTEPKDGYARWTLDLLKEEVEEKLKKTIGRTTIYKVLLANEVKPWREKNMVHWGEHR
jgi:putative transposase